LTCGDGSIGFEDQVHATVKVTAQNPLPLHLTLGKLSRLQSHAQVAFDDGIDASVAFTAEKDQQYFVVMEMYSGATCGDSILKFAATTPDGTPSPSPSPSPPPPPSPIPSPSLSDRDENGACMRVHLEIRGSDFETEQG